MTLKDAQEKVAKFNELRGWGKGTKNDSPLIKDFLLNITEEVGEVWNIIKWVGPEEQKKLIEQNKKEFVDFIGDELYLIFKIAYLLDIDPQEAFEKTMKDYEVRFPVDKMKQVKHGNPLAGGIDDKQSVERQ